MRQRAIGRMGGRRLRSRGETRRGSRRWRTPLALLGALLGLSFAFAPPVVAEPASDPLYLPEAGQQEWDRRLEDAAARLRSARSTLGKLEAEYAEARREDYPRGEPFEALRAQLSAARDRWQRLRERVPSLLEEARRAGVHPEVLRRHRSEIRRLSQPRSGDDSASLESEDDETRALDAVDDETRDLEGIEESEASRLDAVDRDP